MSPAGAVCFGLAGHPCRGRREPGSSPGTKSPGGVPNPGFTPEPRFPEGPAAPVSPRGRARGGPARGRRRRRPDGPRSRGGRPPAIRAGGDHHDGWRRCPRPRRLSRNSDRGRRGVPGAVAVPTPGVAARIVLATRPVSFDMGQEGQRRMTGFRAIEAEIREAEPGRRPARRPTHAGFLGPRHTARVTMGRAAAAPTARRDTT